MKLIGKLLIILLGCSSCEPNTDMFGFHMNNQSDMNIDIYVKWWSYDTVIPYYQDYKISEYNWGFERIERNSERRIAVPEGFDSIEELFDFVRDTISVFVFSVDTLAKYSWEEMCSSYNVLQRYDFLKEDMEHLKHTVFYPPTAAMRNIKMWPPYKE